METATASLLFVLPELSDMAQVIRAASVSKSNHSPWIKFKVMAMSGWQCRPVSGLP